MVIGIIKYLILGFVVNWVTSLDDTLTRIPIISSIAKSRTGKVAFSIGNLFAAILAIIVAIFFSNLIHTIPYYRQIMAVLLFVLAGAIYFNIFVHKARDIEERELKKIKPIPPKRFFSLLVIGFIISFTTFLDDIIAFTPLFLEKTFILVSSIGILVATITQIFAVIFFAEKINKLKYKEEIASLGLIILGILLLAGII